MKFKIVKTYDDQKLLLESRRGQTSLKKTLVLLASLVSKNFNPNIDYCVHHIDENPDNYSLDNIVIMSRSDHSSFHHSKKRKNLNEYKSVIEIGKYLYDIVQADLKDGDLL